MRAVIKQQTLKAIQQEHHPVKVFVAPTIKFMEWRVAIQTDAHMTMLEKHMVGMWCLVIKWNVKIINRLHFMESQGNKDIRTF